MKVPINKITGGPMFAQGLTVPQFNQLGPYELNSTPDALPTTSLNGITGTWNPTTIDTSESGTTTYTFTPDGGQSAIPVTMDIQVIVLETSYFIMTVGLPYTVPTLAASGPYDYRVDVVETSEVYVNQTGDCAISGSGTATIKISGLFPHIYVNDQYGNQNIKSVEQWGTNKWQSFERAFYGAYGVSWNFTDAPDLSEVENMSYAFANVNTNLPASINNWDVSNVTNMSYTFGYFSVFNRPLNYWNVLNVTNMTYMFAYNGSFNQDISTWCVSLIPSKPSNFDTNTTAWVKTNRQPAWGTCPGLTFAQLGPYVIDETPDEFPTTSLNGIVGTWNPSTIDTTKSGTTTYTFTATNPIYGTYDMDIVVNKIVPTFTQLGPYQKDETPDALPTTSLNGITGSWNPAVIDTSESGTTTYTFTPDGGQDATTMNIEITATSVNSFIITVNSGTNKTLIIDTDTYTYDYNIKTSEDNITNITGDYTLTFDNADTDYLVEFTGTFPWLLFSHSTNDIKEINQWGNNQWLRTAYMFSNNENLVANYTDTPDMSNCTHMTAMFSDCAAFNGSVANWNITSVLSTANMFQNCTSFNQPLTGWNPSEVTTMQNMFYGCISFNQNITFNSEKVTDMIRMFYGCTSFNGDPKLKTGALINMNEMFRGCTSFNRSLPWNIDEGYWDMNNAINMSAMFRGATAYMGYGIEGWRTPNATNMTDMFRDITNFNKNLSSWCVSKIYSKPSGFDTGCVNWVLPQPVWGTCPS